jgi:VanZ family protein
VNEAAARLLRPGWERVLLPSAAYLVLAFVLGSLHTPPPGVGALEFGDKIAHAAGFALMQWTHARSLCFLSPRLGPLQSELGAALTATAAGALLEAWQYLLPHRTADLADLAADALGAALAAAVALLVARIWPRGVGR